jgi:ribosomal protein S27AE
MQLELHCPRCSSSFVAEPDTPAAEVLDRMMDEGPWRGLGDGETFEDMIFNALVEHGAIRCPQCGTAAAVSEESLCRLTLEVLGSW